MKRSLLSIAIAVCCIGIASNAMADGRGHDRGDRGHHHSHRHDRHPPGHHKHFDRHHHDHHARDRRNDARWHAGPPPRVYHAPPRVMRWERGGRLPARYRHERYVVRDWHARHFHRPPRGYQWVSVGSDYLLVGIATGVILQTILRD
jgi:Ni/Co efflux regulator RcnB